MLLPSPWSSVWTFKVLVVHRLLLLYYPPKLNWEPLWLAAVSFQDCFSLSHWTSSVPVADMTSHCLTQLRWEGWFQVPALFQWSSLGNAKLCNLQQVIQPCWVYSLANIWKEQTHQSTKWFLIHIFGYHSMQGTYWNFDSINPLLFKEEISFCKVCWF